MPFQIGQICTIERPALACMLDSNAQRVPILIRSRNDAEQPIWCYLVYTRVDDQFVRPRWGILHECRPLRAVDRNTIGNPPARATPAALPKLGIKKKLFPRLGY